MYAMKFESFFLFFIARRNRMCILIKKLWMKRSVMILSFSKLKKNQFNPEYFFFIQLIYKFERILRRSFFLFFFFFNK